MPTIIWEEESGFGDGDPLLSLQGSGTAVPRGVETVFEFNGLKLNDRSVIDKYRIISIDGLDDADVRDSREDNPSEHGETAYNAFYGGRTIALRGRVEAYELNKLRDMQQALRSAFADLNEKRLYFRTGQADLDHFIVCRKFSKNQWAEEQTHGNLFVRDFLITLRASNPRFLRLMRNEHNVTGLTADSEELIEVVNYGNFLAQPIIRLHGPLDKFVLTNTTTGEAFALKSDEAIEDGDYYELNTEKNTFTDSAGNNVFHTIDAAYDSYIQIKPGINTFSLQLDSTATVDSGSSVEILFRDSYI